MIISQIVMDGAHVLKEAINCFIDCVIFEFAEEFIDDFIYLNS